MVKIAFLFASIASLLFTINAQVPEEIKSIANSVLANPNGVQSQIASLSAYVSQLPTQYQASAYSGLAAASKTLDSIAPKQTGGSSAGNPSSKPVKYMAVAAAGAAIAVGVLA